MHKFINAHFRSEYSILSSAISIDKSIEVALANNEEYLVISELNNFFSLAEFSEKATKANLKPIYGIELEFFYKQTNIVFNLILIAKNYQSLIYLMSLSAKKLSNEALDLEQINLDNLIVIDHPRLGFKAKYKNPIDIEQIFYLDDDINKKRSILISEKIAFDEEDVKILNIFDKIKDPKIDKEFNYPIFNNYHSSELMVRKTNQIISSAFFALPKSISDYKLAQFKNDLGISSYQYLEKLVWSNYQSKYKQKFFSQEDATKRIEFELSVIKKLNIADYFLIIWDLISFSKNNSIAIGPGRGSAASSIICYILNITTINPLEHNLLFERFLNLERISMPDIDIDIQDNKRDKVIEYVFQKYHQDNCALISTFQKLSARSALKDIAKIFKISFAKINEITKLIPFDLNLEQAYNKISAFRAVLNTDPAYEQIFNIAKKIENFPRQLGLHAAGIIISEDKLINHIPIFKDQNKVVITQFSNNYLEKWGMLKIDLLGLKTLTIISSIVDNIKQNVDQYFDLNKINFNDEKTNKLLSMGDTTGIFQLESFGMMSVLKKAKVNKFLDLVDIISLYRPGPIKNIDTYVKNKNNPNQIKKIDPVYDAIVAPTNGIIIYQEQIMLIAQNFSKMSFSEADLLRKAVSKKNEEAIQSLKQKFISQSVANAHDLKTTQMIYNQIEKFAQYGFPKAHAVSYATLSYQMAFLKTRYPKYFYEAILAILPPKETLKKYIEEIRKFGLSVIGPDINLSKSIAKFLDNQSLVMPLTLVKGLGSVVNKKLIGEREKNGKFESFLDFILRAKSIGISDAMIQTLIEANTLREFGNIKELAENLNSYLQYFKLISFNDKDTNELILDKEGILPPNYISVDQDINFEIDCENKHLSMIFSAFPSLKYESDIKLANLKEGNEYVVAVAVLAVKEILDKNKKQMGIISVYDSSKTEDIFIFEKQWDEFANIIKMGQVIKLKLIKKTNPYKNITNYIIKSWRVLNG